MTAREQFEKINYNTCTQYDNSISYESTTEIIIDYSKQEVVKLNYNDRDYLTFAEVEAIYSQIQEHKKEVE